MDLRLRYREGHFAPGEAAAITEVSLNLQRDWRSQGLLKAREGGQASFTPRELAEMRIMVKLRGLGLPLPLCRQAAEDAAPGVIFAALANHLDKALAVDAPPEVAAEFIKALEKTTDAGYLYTLSDITNTDRVYRYALIQNGECSLLYEVGEDVMSETDEVAGLIHLWGVSKAIVDAASRPLFTLVVPASFRKG